MPSAPTVTVVLARFDDLLARGLRELIETDSSLTILAAGVEHQRIGVVLRAHRPDVAILDVGALGKLSEVRGLTAQHPDTRFVLLGDDPSMEECAQLIAFGASATLARNTQSRDVLNAVHLASRGLQVMPRASSQAGGRPMAAGHRLTGREAEVLPLLQQGRSNAEIALALQVSVETVRTHARNIYRKFGVSSRRELAAAPAPERKQEQVSAVRPPLRWGTTPVSARRGHGLRNR